MTNEEPEVTNEEPEVTDEEAEVTDEERELTNENDGESYGDTDAADAADAAESLVPIAPVPPGAMRVSDAERSSALEALGEHFTAGRVTIDEYGERTAKVTVTKTVDDLAELFDDLPAPHPILPGHGTPPTAPDLAPVGRSGARAPSHTPPPTGQSVADTRSTAQKLVGVAAGASVFVALALFFVTGSWLWFLLIPGISAAAGAIWGPDWKEPDAGRGGRRELGDS